MPDAAMTPVFSPPSAREEAWRYSPLRGWKFDRFVAPAAPSSFALPEKPDWADAHAVLVNGHALAGTTFSSEPGAGNPEGEGAFATWARQSAQGLLDLSGLGKNLLVNLYGSGDEVLASNRMRLVVPAGETVTLVEEVRGRGALLANTLFDIELEAGARLHHVRVQDQELSAFSMTTTRVRVAEGASYHSVAFGMGSAFARHEIEVDLLGAGARCDLLGANLGANARPDRGQHLDTTSRIMHAVADTHSQEVYKTILADRARGVFQGQIRVAPQAQQISGHQLSRGLLLSDSADLKVKPELEIFADDVVCSHGATIGELDQEQLFYLRSRGLPFNQARRLLLESFVADILDAVELEPVRQALGKRLSTWMDRH